MRIYFAHPMNVYNTELEVSLLQAIRSEFPSAHIENPNSPTHQEECQRWTSGGGTMGYFMNLVESCDAIVALAFGDGRWGIGVSREALHFLLNDLPAWQIFPDGEIRRLELFEDDTLLSIDETRARIRTKDGDTIPYA